MATDLESAAAQFAPRGSHIRRKEFNDALERGDHSEIAAKAVVTCQKCREKIERSKLKLGTKEGDCYHLWQQMKSEQFHACGNCGGVRSIEANHKQPYAANGCAYSRCAKAVGVEAAEQRYPKDERKIYCLSQYGWWAQHGGTAAMEAEAAKCEPLCSMCHRLDPSGYVAHCSLTQSLEYNNSLKRAIGCCENLNCSQDGPEPRGSVVGLEKCYDWDHLVEADKRHEISALCVRYGGVDRHRRAWSAIGKSEILTEIGLPADFDIALHEMPPVAERKCRLLCANCHHTRRLWDPR